jgi:hypothetical protein
VNPLAETDKELVAADAKLGFDDNAAFRQPDLFAMRDESQEDPRWAAAASWTPTRVCCTQQLPRRSAHTCCSAARPTTHACPPNSALSRALLGPSPATPTHTGKVLHPSHRMRASSCPLLCSRSEVAAGKYDLNYIGLDGSIGCMVNGAGLAMVRSPRGGGALVRFQRRGEGACWHSLQQGRRLPHV